MATKALTTTGDAIRDLAEWPALRADVARIKELLAENLGGEQITPADLTVLKVPAGGGEFWTVPTAHGDEACKELDVVLIFTRMARAYWPNPLGSGKGTPPDCSSQDAITGTKYGDCFKCQFSQFGTRRAPDGSVGRGQACKAVRPLYFLSKYSTWRPMMLRIPPTSLAALKKYLLDLADEERALYEVVTRLTLVKSSNADGIGYSEVRAKVVAPITDEATLGKVREISRNWRPILTAAPAVTVVADDPADESGDVVL